ncbi:MAG TPA: homocysteine S-methyltransferase family protein [Candidatus Eisenbacteria bacterium]|nr:homocysteine S-methyltransferase family protein [Candidatus Eisenbacteria bacterium]
MPSADRSLPPPSPSHSLRARLVRGEVVVLDGAMGTELDRRGVPTPLPLWSARALLDAPEVVSAIHEDYIRAGADVVTTNTFRTTARTMRRAGLDPGEAERLTRLAVELARDARSRALRGSEVWIAGAMAPLEDCYRPELAPPPSEAEIEHATQAAILAGAGVDLLLVETMNAIPEAVEATRAAVGTGLPVFVSFIARSEREIWDGELLEDAVRAVDAFHPAAILVNCVPADSAERCLEVLARATRAPIGCYPNAGDPDFDHGTWRHDDERTPEWFAGHATSWLRRGALVVGGCCGTGPGHIRALREAVPPVLVE